MEIFAGTNGTLNDSLFAFRNVQSHRKYISINHDFTTLRVSILIASVLSLTSLRDSILKSVKTIKSDIKRPRPFCLFRPSAAALYRVVPVVCMASGGEISRLSSANERRCYRRFPTLRSQSRLIAQDETESISRSTRLRQWGASLNAKSPPVDIPIEAEEY